MKTKKLYILQCQLRANLPKNRKTRAFSHRINGTAEPTSDFDLAVDASERLSLNPKRSFSDSFAAVLSTYTVDVIDLHAISTEFRASADARKIAIPGYE
ncbi:hypothetical protein [Acidocella sp.]|uniref:hypothetical protein n=1 Tax=Acidocella sp. TaxID=50710 RepID=UPI00261C1A65|nr:hypothetical protein [Acidocella sp.]